MKPNIRWQLLLAVTCLGLVLSLLSFQAKTAGLCSVRVPAAGGTLAEGIVGAPQHLNPLLSDDHPVDRELVSLIFDGLTRYDEDGQLQPNLARDWQLSEDGKTVTFELREDGRWHDGEPFTAEDVAFTYGLIQDEAFPGSPALQRLWQAITIETAGDSRVIFRLPEPYAPFLAATTRGILPAHLLSDVTAAELDENTFNEQPIGTGPFMVAAGSDWRRTGRLRLLPNPEEWQPTPQLDALEFRFYPDAEALINAYRRGEVLAINNVGPTMLPAVATLPQMRLFTAPAPHYAQLLFNMTDSGHPALQSLTVRQALSYALDRDRLIDEALNGQGLPLEGPYLPSSWAYQPELLIIYQSNPVTATQMFDGAGWTLPEGEAIRRREAVTMTLRLLLPELPRQMAVAASIANQWGELGVHVEQRLVQPSELMAALSSREFDVALVTVTPSGDPDLYDFWSQEAIVRGQNFAGWNNREASEALEQARQVHNREERKAYYDRFLQAYNADLPALTLYQHVYTYGLSGAVEEAEIGRIDTPRERYTTMSQWFMLYRDVTVSCPPETS